jgi:hypothetical protein
MGGHARHCPVTVEERFWVKVDKSGGPDACWPWMAARVPAGGYGRFLADRLIAAHRYAWIITNGPIESKEIDVLHSCDNPPCCNPRHLRLGTALENAAEMYRKNRQNTKLNADAVRDIRSSPLTSKELAAKYGVGYSAIWCVRTGRKWSHVQ